MKQAVFSLVILLLALCGCSSDDGLSSVKKSVVGSWQLVERIDGFYPSTQSMPVNTNNIMEFRSDGTVVNIVDGEQISEMPYWLKPTNLGDDSYYLCYAPDIDYSQSTGGTTLRVEGDKLTIHSYGCFASTICVYRRLKVRS
ncbi:hypothetical protein PRMUPPPA20_28380 [Xylanibacter ruminicola]|uniref:Lipocalin-like domain-containing protein n=1 Tax=Xylanibacter ruminicola TaxID=839 RepID=A0AA37MQJ0_XYLRU|nr:hypothetical protein [Xylanibacter ruminicola]GJG34729.1 hypothetical protein PRMUPPPA20_28380 [Xylanibacter ruminicola]SEH89029.1 hypothetical protein SAMN02745192_2108 [Xylanibacter ruminicola]